uniref:Uncharacterized protein n=1 Tax=Nelumbo nucifera TaxID=4432 RepID=A0A822YR27_NELNU|nr:TPA_asm: hypothetical protein HUJ06_012346 [Nelumbo nucifera]
MLSQCFSDIICIQRSLRVRKKAFDRTITELDQKTAEEALANEVLEKLGGLVRECKGIERKLSTTYSLGREGVGLQPQHALPLYDGSTKSYSFQGTKRESFTIFHKELLLKSYGPLSFHKVQPQLFITQITVRNIYL